VSEQILNSTSTQLGYTVPFTLIHAGKYPVDMDISGGLNTSRLYNQ